MAFNYRGNAAFPEGQIMYVAVYLILLRQNQVLLSQRLYTGFEDGKYGLPAGHVEKGEKITVALIRETKEEIGITISEKDIEFLHVMNRNNEDGRIYIDFYFTAKKWSGDIKNCEPSKCQRLSWFHFHKLPDNIIPYVENVLKNCFSKKQPFSEIGWQ